MRGGIATAVVVRERLLARLADAAVVLLEAPGGYGKTTLAMQAAERWDLAVCRVVLAEEIDPWAELVRAARRAGLPDVAEAVDPADATALTRRLTERGAGVTVVVDEVQRATDEASRWLVELADSMPAGSHLVVVGRRIGRRLAAHATGAGIPIISADELRFDRDEVARVVGADVDALDLDAVMTGTHGWPAAVTVTGTRLRSGRADLPSSTGAAVLADLVGDQLASAPPPVAELVARLAHLPLVSAEAAAAVGGHGSLDALLDLGLPIRFRPDGWGELSDPIRELLMPRADLGADAARAVAEVYVRHSAATEGCGLLLRRGDLDGLVELLDAMSWQQLAALGLPTLSVLLEALPDELVAERVDLLARAAIAADDTDAARRAEWLQRGLRLAPMGAGRRAVRAEVARDLARDHHLDDAVEELRVVLEECRSDELLTRGRALLALGVARLVMEQGTARPETVEDLDRSIALFRLAGETRFAAVALRTTAFGAHFNLGELDLAATKMNQAAALLPAPDHLRALFLTYVADIDRDLGRWDAAHAALDESMAIAQRLGIAHAIGFAAWSHMLLATERRDRAAAERWQEMTERHSASWIERGAALDYYAHLAEMWTIFGEPGRALAALEILEPRAERSGYVWPTRSARARFEAVFGEPERAEAALDELDRVGPPRDASLRHLIRAVCAHRRGDERRAADQLAEARRCCVELGDPDRLERREPELLSMLGHTEVAPAGGTTVRVLGGFRVDRAGADVTPGDGRPSTLVKALTLRSTLTVDAAIDLLWPDADVVTGRARLRNLLNRIKTTSGDLVARDGELLRLGRDVDVDLVEFERAATTASSAPPDQRVGLARTALGRHTGELLPGDVYVDWTEAPRERVRRLHLSLLDLVARHAIEHGDLDEAVELLDRAIELEPGAGWRYTAAADALVRQGRHRAASDLIRRAQVTLADLGLRFDDATVTLAS